MHHSSGVFLFITWKSINYLHPSNIMCTILIRISNVRSCVDGLQRKLKIKQGGCSSDIAYSYFLHPSKFWSILYHGSVGTSSEWNQRKLTLALTLDLILPPVVFHIVVHNKICVFILIFTELSFSRLIHGLFFIRGGNFS